MVKAYINGPVVECTTVIFSMAKNMATENIHKKMEKNIWENGKMTNKMAKEKW